ncbi:antibiotic biosynthesis monooxygenase family protein [Azospirillum sp. ST 5-10]|uniref:antibiotic biosynthesis monooxygenase family protein n=1 Tax=unclassified Azospirillum TaxID=2630922 RepID=UPI003F4A3EB3
MYIAMNRFKVRLDAEADFEAVWLNREVHLHTVPGFVEFHMLRGPQREDHRLYASHTVWESEEHFLGWTRSEAFRNAHRGAGERKPLYLGPPQFEGFAVIQTVDRDGRTA